MGARAGGHDSQSAIAEPQPIAARGGRARSVRKSRGAASLGPIRSSACRRRPVGPIALSPPVGLSLPPGAEGRGLSGRLLGTRRLASVTGRGRAGRAPGRGGEAPFEGPWPGPVSGSPRTPSVPRTVGPPRAVPPGTSLTGGWGQCPPEGGDRKVSHEEPLSCARVLTCESRHLVETRGGVGLLQFLRSLAHAVPAMGPASGTQLT
ncbi:unnamed protein product [Rangifer tarandus platyrhynchus]|uniref:Uncharacterized protein n=2 Tax=Rangifer tarandus platyrhynchus TaxID=3082113 RepID=A0ABN8XZP9_RANTA|nr:unnamed protein product [Rangifer tarandus platyrhynchus]CAI9712699.1 unnamed protein product [Rangifer tarandus platyrhynchus]